MLTELAAHHDSVPRTLASLRDRLDNLTDDGLLHRLEDASRAGSLARYRNRQSVYQFTELGHRAYTAVEGVLAARVQDANLSRLVFSDILRDLNGLAEANRAGDGDEVVRRLTSLDRVMEDMARRSARFHLTLGDITRSTEASPEMFLALQARAAGAHGRLHGGAGPLPAPADPRRHPGRGDGARHAAEPRRRGRRAPADAVRGRARRLAAPVGGGPGLVHRRRRGIAGRRTGRGHPGGGVQRDRAAPADHRGPARRGQPGHPAASPGRLGVRCRRRGRRARARGGGVRAAAGPAPGRRARGQRPDLTPAVLG